MRTQSVSECVQSSKMLLRYKQTYSQAQKKMFFKCAFVDICPMNPTRGLRISVTSDTQSTGNLGKI